MATALQRIEGMTQISIEGSGTAPTQSEVTEYLLEGIKDLTNKIVNIRPDEAFKFAAESEAADDTGITVLGKILSVVREHDSTSILRPCSPMPPELRYEATDSSSLHYRSKYNPGFYILNKKLHIRPAAAGDDNDVKVSQIVYGSADHGSNMGSWTNFPVDYEELVILYASAQSFLAAASDIQNNMPTKPTEVAPPTFEKIESDVLLPQLPMYNVPEFHFHLTKVRNFIQNEDFDAADKWLDTMDREKVEYEKRQEQEKARYDRDVKIFDSELANLEKNKEREFNIIAGNYRSDIYKYQYDIANYQALLQESLTKYKWYIEQYVNMMNEYNKSISISITPMKKPEQAAPKAAPTQKPQEVEE